MPHATVFFVVSDEPERLWRGALWALTAASVDESVSVWLTAPALATLLREPVWAPGSREAGMPHAAALLTDARELGSRVLTCETELALAGLSVDAVRGLVDAVESLPAFWRASAGERVTV